MSSLVRSFLGLVGLFLVVDAPELVERGLLEFCRPRRRLRRFCLQRGVHALMSLIVLRVAPPRSLELDPRLIHQMASLESPATAWGLLNGTPLSVRITSGSPYSACRARRARPAAS